MNSGFFAFKRSFELSSIYSIFVDFFRPCMRTWSCSDTHIMHNGIFHTKHPSLFIEYSCCYVSSKVNEIRGATQNYWSNFLYKLVQSFIIVLCETSMTSLQKCLIAQVCIYRFSSYHRHHRLNHARKCGITMNDFKLFVAVACCHSHHESSPSS